MTSMETGLDTSREVALAMYRQMRVIRTCEEQLARAHQQGLIHGACHTYVGQEAISAGVASHLRQTDVVFSTHRGHAHALVKGVSPRALMAELFGRSTGCSQGRGGSMHLFAPEVGLMGTSGIVGPCLLQAAGAGYSFKILKTDQVAVAFFGDGAVNNGAFHEGLNMASIWKLPVIFACENNQFATEVPFQYAAGNPSVAERGQAYGIPAHEVDGNDALAVCRVAGGAVTRARRGEGPTLLEFRTYRTRPHAEGMGDFTYRSREDVDAWKGRCPIKRLSAHLIDSGAATADELAAIDSQVAAEIADARSLAEKDPWPDPATAALHVFAQPAGGASRTRRVSVVEREPAGASGSTRELTFIKATHEALAAEMAANPRIFVMGEGIGRRGGNFATTTGLFDLYGAERLCDTPICERGFVGLACGAAMTGTRPVIDFMFADFLLDAMGELINQISKMQYMSSGRLDMPVLLRGCIGIGHSAATHHSGNYYSLFANIPGLVVVVPSTPCDAKGLFRHALRSFDPVVFLEHREILAVKGPVPDEDYEIPFGKGVIREPGTDVTVVAVARMAHLVLEARRQLAQEGISVEVVDPRTVAPLDVDTILESLARTGRLLVVDEAFPLCSLASEVAAQAADSGFDLLDAPIKRLTGRPTPTPYSPPLEAAVIPQLPEIVQAIRALVNE